MRASAREGKKQVEAVVPIVAELARVLERVPADSLVYLLNENGRAWRSAKSLGNRMRKWCDEIVAEDGSRPFDGLSSHGLRKGVR